MLVNSNINIKTTTFDDLIIGSGPAGIACALKLSKNKNRKICIIEAGGFEDKPKSISQNNYKGEITGDPYPELDKYRARMFGGTLFYYSHCLRFFEKTDKFFSDGDEDKFREELDSYMIEALNHLGAKNFMKDNEIKDTNFKFFKYQYSDRKEYTVKKLKEKILSSENIYLFLNQNLTKIQCSGNRVANIQVKDYDKKAINLKAKNYILACGAIENSRILLFNQVLNKNKLITNSETLGKYYTDHLEGFLGEASIWDTKLSNMNKNNPRNGFAYFAKNKHELQKGKYNHGIRIYNHRFHAPGKYLRKKFGKSANALNNICRNETSDIKKKLLYDKLCESNILILPEMKPNKNNKIFLSDKKDFFDIPRVKLNIDYSATRNDLKEFAIDFGKFLIKKDLGRIRVAEHIINDLTKNTVKENDTHSIKQANLDFGVIPAEYPYTFAGHPMGGTKVSHKPENGIVDENLKVHGQENLYVLGSSVFYNTGFANPTLTIVKLAHRLADKLNNQ